MAIAFNSASSNEANDTTVSVSHTAAGSDRCVIIGLYQAADSQVSSISYGAQTPTLIRRYNIGFGSGNTLWLYRLVAPDTGAQTVSATFDSTAVCAIGVVSYTGVDQTTPVGTEQLDENNDATPISVDVTTTSGQVVVEVTKGASSSMSVGADQTARVTRLALDSGGYLSFGMSEEAHNTGTATMSWDISGPSGRSGIIAVAMNASAGASETTLSPSQAALSLSGLLPATNAFTSVRIREVLINEAGSPVGNRNDISLIVWYSGVPAGPPDLSYSALTTDADGTASWSIATGSLQYNQTIAYLAFGEGSPPTSFSAGRITPRYE